MAYFSFENQNIYYITEGEGYPLLLLHGNLVSSKMFHNDIPYFSQFFQVISFDYPSHGQSDRLNELRDDFWNYNARCAFALLKLLKVDECYVIGTSGGGLVGINLAIMADGMIKKLIADSFLGEYLKDYEAKQISEKRIHDKESDYMTQQFWKSMHGDDWQRVVDLDIDLTLRVGRKNLPLIYGDLNNITADVLAIASLEDELIPNIENRTLSICSKIPHCRPVIVSKGKHPFMTTQKIEFRKIALEFFGIIE